MGPFLNRRHRPNALTGGATVVIALLVLGLGFSGTASAQQTGGRDVGELSVRAQPSQRGQGRAKDPAGQTCRRSKSYLDPATAGAESLSPERVRSGWLAAKLIGQGVRGSDGEELGNVQDILVGADKKITGVIVERGGFLGLGHSTFRIAWKDIDLTPNEAGITASIADVGRPERPGGRAVIEAGGEEFRVSDIIGDRTRIGNRTTLCYQQRGRVKDVVFDQTGTLVAIIEARSETFGGGLYAYPFYGYQAGWRPFYGYYDLPLERLESAAPKVTVGRFERSPASGDPS